MNKNYYLKIVFGLLGTALAAGFSSFQIEKVSAGTKSKTGALIVKTNSLCQANEQTIWSCTTTKNKIASVCASKDLTAEQGYVQYRFGTPRKIELEAPKNRADSQKFFGFSRYTRPLVTLLMLRFENGDYAYEIHVDDNSEEKPPVRAASVDVYDKNGETVSSVVCKLPSIGSLMKLEDIVPRYEEGDI